MSKRRQRRRREEKASPDLTPMIDVTFQLLIFFILATRFKVDERNHQVQLPKDEGLDQTVSIPKEQITIYCNWDDDAQGNSYVVAIDARGRRPVEQSFATLEDLVVFPSDSVELVHRKKRLYTQIFDNVVLAVEAYIISSGAPIEKLEISFAKNAMEGAVSGTAPWMFVSLAIDAAAQVNRNRVASQKEALSVTFKFTDALQRYSSAR